MGQLWILAEENVGGTPVLRKLASLPDGLDDKAVDQLFNAIVAGDAYEKVFLVEVKKKG